MSTTTVNDQKQSVDDGIKIIEFIQKNKDQIQKTYGRSAITGLTTRQKAEEWEKYISDQHEQGSRSSNEEDDLLGTEKEGGKGCHSRAGTGDGTISIPDYSVSKSISDRDHQRGDAQDSDGESLKGWCSIGPDRHSNDDIRDPNSEGNVQSRESSDCGRGNIQETERLDRGDIHPAPTGKTKHGIRIIESTNEKGEGIDETLEMDPATQERRLKSTANLKHLLSDSDHAVNPIKKGTEESSVSTYSKERPQSESGAILHAQELDPGRYKRSASVEGALESASCADSIDVFRSTSTIEEVHSKIDTLLTNQNRLIEKLNAVFEVKEELNNLKKSVNNLSLAVSTIESYISSLMIIIPGSGKDETNNKSNVNPDLKMVIGRDKGRGLTEAIERPNRNLDEPFGEDLFEEPKLKSSLLLEDVDKKKNHAAQYIPSSDDISIKVIQTMIKNKVKDKNLQKDLMEFVENSRGDVPIWVIHNEITQIMDSLE
ncbi:phosphoprotein [Bat paramyxovirus]|uniref:phosphoprotein n=1 Tax=Bat paramyxovirus TaxID=1300978 RepID=UPI0005FC78E7|nr:phosphoprotein [Bat paramyxovirus]AIF74187.1 phosphoprotein [Bat paramyxovirus]